MSLVNLRNLRNLYLSTPEVTDNDSGEVLSIQKPNNTISIVEGQSVNFHVEIKDSQGNVLPIGTAENPKKFALPVSGLLNTSPRIIDIEFINGVADKIISWPKSGLWEITENQVNMDIEKNSEKFYFEGIRIKVREA